MAVLPVHGRQLQYCEQQNVTGSNKFMVLHSCKHSSLPVATKHGPAMSPAVPYHNIPCESCHNYVMFTIISFTACVIEESAERERYIYPFLKANHKCCRPG